MKHIADTWALIFPFFWRSPHRWRALALLAGALLCHVGLTLVGVGFNVTSGAIFNAIQDHNLDQFLRQLARWGGLFVALLAAVAQGYYFTQLLSWRWRDWMTRHLLDRWMENSRFYHLQVAPGEGDNPDQRIAEDVALFVDKTLDLFLGLFHAVAGLGSFTIILWKMSEDFDIFGFRAPGLLLWCALLYSLVGTGLSHLLGRRLPGLDVAQQKAEADFRFSLVRVREHGASIALMQDGPAERLRLDQAFSHVLDNWLQIIRCKKRLVLINRAFGQMSTNYAYLIMAPRYFAGGLSLGTLVQANQAFFQFDLSLNWIIQNYQDLSLWVSAMRRLRDFQAALDRTPAPPASVSAPIPVSAPVLSVAGLSVSLPDGRGLLRNVAFDLPAGGRMALVGPSGAGKSTLISALAGLWPFTSGAVRRNGLHSLMVLPQRPYLPVASLRSFLGAGVGQGERLSQILAECRLDHLRPHLDQSDHWQRRLSPGEIQRLVLARAMLHRPGLLLLDEATSAQDEETQAVLYRALFQALPDSAILSVAHRRSVVDLHPVVLDIQRFQYS